MVNVVIRDRDRFFRQGAMRLIEDYFREEHNESACFSFELTKESVATADIIVVDMRSGEQYVCWPALLSRKKGILISFVEPGFSSRSPLPSCFRDVIFVSRETSELNLKYLLRREWEKRQNSLAFNCTGCGKKTLSEQQTKIVHLLKQGFSFNSVSTKLRLNPKTVFAHKYILMNKFGLKTSCELQRFIQCLTPEQESQSR